MAIGIRSSTSGGTTTNGTDGTFSVSKPSSVEDGDYLVVLIGKQDEPDISPPGDWSTFTGAEGGSATGNDTFCGCYFKKITNAAGEPSSYTFTSAGTNEPVGWWIGSLSGVDPATPEDATGSNVKRSNDASPGSTSVTTTNANTMVMVFWAVNTDTSVTNPASPWTTLCTNVGGNGVLTASYQIYEAGSSSTGTVDITDVTSTMETQVGAALFRAEPTAIEETAQADIYRGISMGSDSGPFEHSAQADRYMGAVADGNAEIQEKLYDPV